MLGNLNCVRIARAGISASRDRPVYRISRSCPSVTTSPSIVRSASSVPGTSAESSRKGQETSDGKRKLPRWAAKYSDRFKNHPTSHITSFLILHELTAVLPLPVLWWFFHSFDWTPDGLPIEALEKGVEAASKQLRKWGMLYTGDDGSRYIFEGAAAYAVIKLLLPARIAVSLSLTPWFARRVVVPITSIFKTKTKAPIK